MVQRFFLWCLLCNLNFADATFKPRENLSSQSNCISGPPIDTVPFHSLEKSSTAQRNSRRETHKQKTLKQPTSEVCGRGHFYKERFEQSGFHVLCEGCLVHRMSGRQKLAAEKKPKKYQTLGCWNDEGVKADVEGQIVLDQTWLCRLHHDELKLSWEGVRETTALIHQPYNDLLSKISGAKEEEFGRRETDVRGERGLRLKLRNTLAPTHCRTHAEHAGHTHTRTQQHTVLTHHKHQIASSSRVPDCSAHQPDFHSKSRAQPG